MNKTIFFLLLCILLIATEAYSQPLLTIDKGDKIDFGSVSIVNAKLSTILIVSNKGDETFKIANIQVNCGCVLALTDKREIKAGESATMNVTFDASGFSGPVTKMFTINCTDPKVPGKSVELSATVIKPIIVEPNVLQISGAIGQTSEATFTIWNNSQSDITLKSFNITPDVLNIDQSNPVVLKAGYNLSLKVYGKIQNPGVTECMINIPTSNSEMPLLKISCNVRSAR